MTSSRRQDFSQWWFHQLSESIRSRHRNLDKAEARTRHHAPSFLTWSSCIGRNKCKIERVYRNIRMKQLKINGPWDHCIAWQKKKLTRLHDRLEAWRKREHLILKRMNAHNFPRNKAPDILWNFKVYKQAWKAKRIIAKKHNRPARIPIYEQLLRQTKSRLYRQYREELAEPDDLWTVNIKANKLKINTIHLRKDWTQCIFSNMDKMRYRYHEHNKKNKEGYRHLVFK